MSPHFVVQDDCTCMDTEKELIKNGWLEMRGAADKKMAVNTCQDEVGMTDER